jgi:cytochrome P450
MPHLPTPRWIQDYTMATGLQLKKNDMISISLTGIHMDERYYPNPEQFNPENFSKEARSMRSP